MIEIIIGLVVVALIASILMHHYSMKKQIQDTVNIDATLLRQAAHQSLTASTLAENGSEAHLVHALMETSQAQQTLSNLLQRRNHTDLVGVNLPDTLKAIQKQHKDLLTRYLKLHPEYVPVDTPEVTLKLEGLQ